MKALCQWICCIALVTALPAMCGAETARESLTAGLNAAKQKNLAEEKTLLAQVVSQYPATCQAVAASWKLGQIANQEKNEAAAKQHFQWVITNHPRSPKAADAWLSLAMMCSAEDYHGSIGILENVVNDWPTSPQSKVARVRISCLYANLKDFDKAVQYAREVREDAGSTPQVRATAYIREAEGLMGRWRK